MNARYPASSTGMWGQVKRTHVVAAIAATLGIMVGAAGAAAWDVSDDSDSSGRAYTPPPINIDRLAEAAAVPEAPSLTGTSGGDLISSFGRGFVDVDSLIASIGPVAPVTSVAAGSADGAIAEHDNALAGNGIVDDSRGGTVDRAGRGQVFSD